MTLVGEESDFKDSEPERKRKKIEDPSLGTPVAADVSKGKVTIALFFLIHKK